MTSANVKDNGQKKRQEPVSIEVPVGGLKMTGHVGTVEVSANASASASVALALQLKLPDRSDQIATAVQIVSECTDGELVFLTFPEATDEDLLKEKGLDGHNPIHISGLAGAEIQKRKDAANWEKEREKLEQENKREQNKLRSENTKWKLGLLVTVVLGVLGLILK